MENKTEEPKIFKKTCPKCGKEFYSLSEKQLNYNYISHLGSCNSNTKGNNKGKDKLNSKEVGK